MKKRQKGSITVEATLFLPLFFLADIVYQSTADCTVCGRSGGKRSGTVQLYSGKDRNSGFFGRTEFQVRGF